MEAIAFGVEDAEDLAFDHAPGAAGYHRGQLGDRDRQAVFIDDQPAIRGERGLGGIAGLEVEDAHRRAVEMGHAAFAILHDDAVVHRFDQLRIAALHVGAAGQVAGDGDDALLALVVDRGRMHLDREARAIGAHVGDLDHVAVAATERIQHRDHVIARQVGVDGFDGLANQVVARAAKQAQAGGVHVEHGAVPIDDADRIGHGIEEALVATLGRVTRRAGFLPGVHRIADQAAAVCIKVGTIGQFAQPASEFLFGNGRADRGLAVFHESYARPALLPVSRPSRPANHTPVSTSFVKSVPVSMPMPRSM